MRSALQRHESRGLHYSRDYPDTLPVSFPTVVVREVRSRNVVHALINAQFGKG